jgi:hypothetical protein
MTMSQTPTDTTVFYRDGDEWMLELYDDYCIQTKVETGYQRVTHREDFRAAFDLTRMWGRDVWRDLVDQFGLEFRELEIDLRPGKSKTVFAWCGEDVLIRTTTNPLTGEKARYYPGEADSYDPSDHLAYCGYIHLEGEESAVRAATEHIKSNSSYKEVSVGEWCV